MQKSRSSAGSTDLDTGARIGRYVVLEHIGSGAMGVVYSAYDPELDRRIAVKLLKVQTAGAGGLAPARLLREAKAMARLAHPNVIAVHDVGLFDEQVFLAMEFLSGGTLKGWLATKGRSWREVLDVFIAAGRGLAAAHVAGLVHRDFKPDNVLLDKDGRPRVVDFGLARDAVGSADDAVELSPAEVKLGLATLSATATEGGGHLQTLTRTGALSGTPAYMAPEQFLGERADERTDQFSFCVALYEALYGERPFAGDDLISLSVSVTEGQLRPLPKDRGIPVWIRRVILRGLRPNAGDRFPSMASLILALEDDPAVKRRRRLIAGSAVGVVVVSILVARQMVLRKRQEVDREIARYVDAAMQNAATAAAKAVEARQLRHRAWDAFDGMDSERGEALWRQARTLLPAVDSGFDRAEKSLDLALALDGSRHSTRAELADILYRHITFAEDFRLEAKLPGLAARLGGVDTDGAKQKTLAAPGTLVVRAAPRATSTISRYERDLGTGARRLVPVGAVHGEATTTLPAGSYRLTLAATDGLEVQYPFEIRRGETTTASVNMPSAGSIPAGFVYVPAGEFLFGDYDEVLRTQFLGAVPMHRRHTDAFMIARRETSYAEWIMFLDALPAAERARYAPNVSTAIRGSLRLKEVGGAWQLAFQPTTRRYVAAAGEPIVYSKRKRRAHQDWLQFPVAGISPTDANRYAEWLRATQRVPGARLCTEVEWERAARGADDRLFPNGDELAPEDANFDVTYGRIDEAYGPDAVGSFPASRSPFGVDDLAGNLYELVTSSQQRNEMVVRGGGYYFTSVNSRVTNRQVVPAMFRDVTAGIRICATAGGDRDEAHTQQQ